MLRGNYAAKIDDKGRLKIPNAFRGLVEGKHGKELFVTSLTGEYVRIYPTPVWLALEEKLAAVPSTHPARLSISTASTISVRPLNSTCRGGCSSIHGCVSRRG